MSALAEGSCVACPPRRPLRSRPAVPPSESPAGVSPGPCCPSARSRAKLSPPLGMLCMGEKGSGGRGTSNSPCSARHSESVERRPGSSLSSPVGSAELSRSVEAVRSGEAAWSGEDGRSGAAACSGEACLGDACLGEACLGEACLGEACLGEACLGEACFGVTCLAGAACGKAARSAEPARPVEATLCRPASNTHSEEPSWEAIPQLTTEARPLALSGSVL